MNWLKNLVRPKLRELVGGQKEIPDNLWHNCPNCEEMIFHRDLEKDLWVCRYCGHHMRMEAGNRLEMLFDNGAYQKVELGDVPTDPLKFRDRRKYTERTKEAQNRTGETDALIVAHGKMGGSNVVIAALNFSFMGGSMGIAVGQGLLTAARLAVAGTTVEAHPIKGPVIWLIRVRYASGSLPWRPMRPTRAACWFPSCRTGASWRRRARGARCSSIIIVLGRPDRASRWRW